MSPPDSNEVLIKARIIPALDAQGQVKFVGRGKNTANVHEIEERFRELRIKADWARVHRIAGVRSDLEHHYPNVTRRTLYGVLTDSFLVVRTFIATELSDDPRRLLGEETWQTMLQVSEVYEDEKKFCDKLLEDINWGSVALAEGLRNLFCGACGSQLLKPKKPSACYSDVTLVCSSCGEEERLESFIPRALDISLEWDDYVSLDDGGDLSRVKCPQCGANAYVLAENRCAMCGGSVRRTCLQCGTRIPGEELESSPMCSWCAYMDSKDD